MCGCICVCVRVREGIGFTFIRASFFACVYKASKVTRSTVAGSGCMVILNPRPWVGRRGPGFRVQG